MNDNERDNWIAAVAHEIKNPVALALANVSLIKITDTEKKFVGYCNGIEQAMNQINALVIQLVESVREPCDAGVFDVGEMLTGLVEESHRAWPQIEFTCKRPSQPMLLTGDEKRIKMVFCNLLKNAVEAVGDSGSVAAEAKWEDACGEQPRLLRVTIRDSGRGIDEQTSALIEAGHYTSKPNGSGMGLFICRNIVSRFGGQFYIRNYSADEGSGGSFSGCEAVVMIPERLCQETRT